MLAIKNGTYKRDYAKRKQDKGFMERKRMMDQIYREKKKLGLDTFRKTDDNAPVNQDWRKYFNSWMKSSEQYKRKGIKTSQKYYRYRLEAIDHYSGGRNCCTRCGLDDVRVLDFDHVNNDGAEQRREMGNNLVYWMKKNNFPQGFQVLCRNCNWLKELEKREKVNKNKWN